MLARSTMPRWRSFEASREKLRLLITPTDLSTVQWTANGHPLSEFPLVSPIAGTLVKRDLKIGQWSIEGVPHRLT